MSAQPVCDRIITYNNRTAVIPGYEGIPQNLLINFVSWTVLLFSFSILRKLAWDYGRIALMKPRKNMWTSLFYSEVRRSISDNDSLNSAEITYAAHDHGFCSWVRTCFTLKTDDLERKAGIDAVQYLRFQQHVIVFMTICMFFSLAVVLPLNIGGILKSPDLQKFGVTTISNLSGDSPSLWAHVVIGFMFFMVAFLLMQHFSKQLRQDSSQQRLFSHRTLMISGISRSHCQRDLILRHFREAYPRSEIEDIQVCYDIRKLVKLDNRWEATKAALLYSQAHLEAKGERPVMIPRCCGWSCTMCYRSGRCKPCFATSQRPHGCLNQNIAVNNNAFSPDFTVPATSEMTVSRIQNDAYHGCCACCPCPAPVDAIDYYTQEAEDLRKKLDAEGNRAVKTKIGIAFITFHTRESAARVYMAYHPPRLSKCLSRPPTSSLSAHLRSKSWTVQFAPTPSNIIWPNLAVTRTVWWMRAVTVNLLVFLIVFFMTTPTYVLNLVNSFEILEKLQISNPIVIQFIPSIILWSVSALLPYVVHNSDRLVGHWTKSGLHLTVMAKTFSLLILMVLILPSLGLTSIPALLQWLFPVDIRPEIPIIPPGNGTINGTTESQMTAPYVPIITVPFSPNDSQSFRWECVFMPDNGAFFVNYVITSSFIGTALELVRLPELITYSCRIMCVRSQAEKAEVRKASQWEFDFGLYYAWTLCVFAVVTSYSLLCPLITPFGLTYLILKHFVDRYNLFFAYLPSRIDTRIHWLAMTFMLFAVILLQLNLFMFIALRLGPVGSPLSVVALCGLVISVLIWLTTVVTSWVFVGSPANGHRFRPGSHHPMLATSRWIAVTSESAEQSTWATNGDQPFTVDRDHYRIRSPTHVAQHPNQEDNTKNANCPTIAADVNTSEEAVLDETGYNRSTSLDTGLTQAVPLGRSSVVYASLNPASEPNVRPGTQRAFVAPILMHLVDQESVSTSMINTELG
ncbi:Transmembrane protein 63B [Fasciolopsis buskii]|uniref:Transmembrane protein 63B n=1 Tax=Fasciolopsis buskii TaxID=27845 RepID=A0A8E0RJC8_9TREM|nr:Transmembrane protein 63B [Fasciolopsis buski]